ncbi:FecR domain-containing protein [uncultured Paraglaciecola sp.]|uniref:FecR family protein n=1 Tax=uncultured Paraglaciecola sp. TaxID=1765024 RepID=UPI0030D8FE44|tara:strand:- start:41903 stop:42880 length:978 start_codon:yes stop_codon:yes gene_type:complete
MKKVTSDTEQQSLFWLTKINSGQFSEADLQNFKIWLKASDNNQTAFRKASLLWRTLAYSPTLTEQPKLLEPKKKVRKKNQIYTWYAVAACLLISVLITLMPELEQPIPYSETEKASTLELRTAKDEIKQFTLLDGSNVWLGAGSRLLVMLGTSSRRTQLLIGEAMFDIYPNSQIPFYVQAGDADIKVLGTVFEVQKRNSGILVNVAKGKVRVAAKNQYQDLEMNESIYFEKNKVLPLPSKIDPQSFALWRSKRFHFVNTQFKDVLLKLNRYYKSIIYIDDPSLSDIPITAAFQLDQLDQLLNSLSSIHHFNWHKDVYGNIHIETK